MTEAEEQRNQHLARVSAGTRFQVGNPGGPGRPRGPVAVVPATPQELAAPHASAAIRKLVALMDKAKDERVQAQAARIILETAKPDDDDKILRMLEDRLRDLRAEAEQRRRDMELAAGKEPTP